MNLRMSFFTYIKRLAFLLAWSPILLSQTANNSAAQMLETHVAVEGQQYCQNDPHLYTVYLKVHLTVTNRSTVPIIIARKVKIPAVQVSKTAEDAIGGKFVYNPDPYEISARPQKPIKFGSTPDPDRFVILGPTEKYELDEWTGVLADLSGSKVDESGIFSGKYVARAVVNTWPYPNNPTAATVEAWRRFGQLTDGIMKSDFFPVDFPAAQTATNCGSFPTPSEADGKRK